MWKTESTAETSGNPASVWSAWKDVARWNAWNPMIRESSLDGLFTTGTRGAVTPSKGPKGSFELTEVQPEKRWSSRAKMPGAMLDFIYELTPVSAGTHITMRAEISGLLSPLFGIIVGRQCQQGLPVAVKNLKARAEEGMAGSSGG